MTRVSCAPEGQQPHFKIAVPQQLAARLPCSDSGPVLPGSSQVPFLTPPAQHPLLGSTPSWGRISIKLTGMARSRRQGQETRRRRQEANMPWRTLLRCLPHGRRACGYRPSQVTERVLCPFHSLQAHMEILGCPHRPPKPACMTTRVNLTSGKLGAQKWEEGTSHSPNGFPIRTGKGRREEGWACISSLAKRSSAPLSGGAPGTFTSRTRTPEQAFLIRGGRALWLGLSLGPGQWDLFTGPERPGPSFVLARCNLT